MSVKVKICGITNLDDGQMAAEAGADLLGFIFHPSSARNVSFETAAEIISKLPAHIVKTAVFVNADRETIEHAISECGFNLLQFHGEESPAFCLGFGVMSMKAFKVRDAASINRISEYKTDAWLLDSYSAAVAGGTGEIFNWSLATEVQKFGRPFFLAGGLTPDNVGEAIIKTRPFGVDVSSGVEAQPGKKDPLKVRAFIKRVRETEG